jgi:hypothetical protein
MISSERAGDERKSWKESWEGNFCWSREGEKVLASAKEKGERRVPVLDNKRGWGEGGVWLMYEFLLKTFMGAGWLLWRAA